MQRWIVLGAVSMILLIGGSGFAYWNHKQNLPHPVWVPLPLNPHLSDYKQQEIAQELKAKLSTTEILTLISNDLNLPKKWRLRSNDEAAGELGRRLFVTQGEVASSMGKVPAINIGVQGPRKDKGVSEEIANHLMVDVRKILGIKAPPTKQF